MAEQWQIYEQAARSVLEHIGQYIGVAIVEGKQHLPGKSGTTWEVDARAYREDGSAFLVVEVRCYTTSSLKQEHLGALAFRIGDVGAAGGIVVSPLPMQAGAVLVAKAAGIEHVRLTPKSTTTDYLAEYMGRRFIGASVVESINATDWCDAEVIRGSVDGPGT
ncbi:MAG TPA: hypothetical protein VFR90_03200 [Methylibium sp.]|uniref:hypothetical protein n=1 Tax=Methylibium sp. TaxID=2067992 RepID=UPI002DBEC9C2|nr:hypothetical protein [Methylibium sp.]HEU4458107.1 hypothetical protein [Methylibium sp.]